MSISLEEELETLQDIIAHIHMEGFQDDVYIEVPSDSHVARLDIRQMGEVPIVISEHGREIFLQEVGN